MTDSLHRNAITPGTRIQCYEIVEVLGQGGFGITYLAYDINLHRNVAIKEFLPSQLAVRTENCSVRPITDDDRSQFEWFLNSFITEARTLAKFNHPNIVRVHSVFEENNTAYMVMEYEHGESLEQIIKRKKKLSEKELRALLFPLFDGLEKVHRKGFTHRDIKPANIYIREDKSPVLLDFGSSRPTISGAANTVTSLYTPGYAPIEQYTTKGSRQGPWTDIYSLAATLYRVITGKKPMDAFDRSRLMLEDRSKASAQVTELSDRSYSKALRAAVHWGLQFKAQDRPQTIAQWRQAFDSPVGETVDTKGAVTVLKGDKTVKSIRPLRQTKRSSRIGLIFAGSFLVIALAGIGWYSSMLDSGTKQISISTPSGFRWSQEMTGNKVSSGAAVQQSDFNQPPGPQDVTGNSAANPSVGISNSAPAKVKTVVPAKIKTKAPAYKLPSLKVNPAVKSLTVKACETKTFSVIDSSGGLRYKWWINNELQQEQGATLQLANLQPGAYEIRVKASNLEGKNDHNWQVRVQGDPPSETDATRWLQKLRQALQAKDIDTLKALGYIRSETEANKLAKKLQTRNDYQVSIENPSAQVQGNTLKITYDRIDRWRQNNRPATVIDYSSHQLSLVRQDCHRVVMK